MKKVFNIALAFISIFMFSACEEDWSPEQLLEDPTGTLSLATIAVDIETSEKEVPRSSVDLSNYIVAIYNESDGVLVESWKYAEMPEVVTLEVGKYNIAVKSHELEVSQWDAPYYYASKSFAIEENKVTEIGELICKLSNVKVSVKYSDALYQALGDDVTVTVEIGNGVLEYSKDEVRVGCFELPENSSSIIASFAGTVNGNYTTLRRVFTDVEVGQHIIITFSLSTGGFNPDLIVDAGVSEDDVDINVPGEDPEVPGERPGEGEDQNGPTITSETLDLDGVNLITSSLIAKVDISVPNGIKLFEVKIISDQLTPELLQEVNLAAEFDLVYPGDLEPMLIELGFPTGDQVLGQTQMSFDITMFMELLVVFPGTHKFQLTVTDAQGLSSQETLTFLAE